MADITRWDPFAEMADLRRAFDRVFDDVRPVRFVAGPQAAAFAAAQAQDSYFPVDLFETEDEIVLKASLPGVKPEDIDISVTGDHLTLKAESKEETESKGQNWYRRERRSGSFVRQFQLPSEVDSAKAAANFEDGVLRLTLPKAETVKPKTIKVEAKPALEAAKP
jgi:HSP20 family protein